jgi:hypothetical protein
MVDFWEKFTDRLNSEEEKVCEYHQSNSESANVVYEVELVNENDISEDAASSIYDMASYPEAERFSILLGFSNNCLEAEEVN